MTQSLSDRDRHAQNTLAEYVAAAYSGRGHALGINNRELIVLWRGLSIVNC